MTATIQRSFTRGELAPSLHARVDTAAYPTALRTCRNFVVDRHGGVSNRPGTTFVGEVKDSTKHVRLIPFVFNATQTYVLEFGDLYMRVHKNGAQVLESTKAITAATNANPGVFTSVAHGYLTGQEVYLTGLVGMATPFDHLNGRNFKIVKIDADTYSLKYMDGTAVDTTAFGAYVSGGTTARVFTLTTTYAEADLPTLNWVQSADVLTLVHHLYPPRDLARISDTNWTITDITFAPGQAAPTNFASSSAGANFQYAITAINTNTREESLPLLGTSTNQTSTLTWDAAAGATDYSIYKALNGVYGFIGTASDSGSGLSFKDSTITPDTTSTPPQNINPFPSPGNYPAVVTYYQQRLVFANTLNDPQKVFCSRTGAFKNFSISTPINDADSVSFTLASRQVNPAEWMADLGGLLIGTDGAEWSVNGGGDGALTPTAINARQQSNYGSYPLPSIIIGVNLLFIQARGKFIRDIAYTFYSNRYVGVDITLFASHLFQAYTINDWTYQQVPNSVVWAARSDGTLLGLTYIKEHEIAGWHRHDFEGGNAFVENVCSIPDGTEDFLYLCIRRTVNGRTVRYIERMATRLVVDVADSIFMDSALSYDGRNSGAVTMTLSGGTNWTYDEILTLTASAAKFVSTDVGNAVFLTAADGTQVRLTIVGFTSTTVVTVQASKTVPADLRNSAKTVWSKALKTIGGLWHLEGKNLCILGDGFVVANPNNGAYVTVTVTNGRAVLDKPYAVLHAGLPVTADIATLNIDQTGGETMADKKKLITRLTMLVEASRGIWAGIGPPPDDTINPPSGQIMGPLTEFKLDPPTAPDLPPPLVTDTVIVNIQPEWNSTGEVFVRQVDPVPLNILAIIPSGSIPVRA